MTVSTIRSGVADRRTFIGGSDARIIMGKDEDALLRLWREKRGEADPEDLSANLIVRLGTATASSHLVAVDHVIDRGQAIFPAGSFKRPARPISRPCLCPAGGSCRSSSLVDAWATGIRRRSLLLHRSRENAKPTCADVVSGNGRLARPRFRR